MYVYYCTMLDIDNTNKADFKFTFEHVLLPDKYKDIKHEVFEVNVDDFNIVVPAFNYENNLCRIEGTLDTQDFKQLALRIRNYYLTTCNISIYKKHNSNNNKTQLVYARNNQILETSPFINYIYEEETIENYKLNKRFYGLINENNELDLSTEIFLIYEFKKIKQN